MARVTIVQFGGLVLPLVSFRHLRYACAVAVLASLNAAVAFAGAPDMTPPTLNLQTFLAQSKALHAANPEVPNSLAAKGSVDVAAQTAPTARTSLPKASADAIDRVLAMAEGGGAQVDQASTTRGLSKMQGNMPAIPSMDSLDHATAQAVVAAFHTPGGMTAYDQAQNAAATAAAANPELDERVAMVRTLYRVDGTDSLIRHFVATQHMKLIITEVNNHIEISHLTDAEKYRMATIAASAETELEEKILTMDARLQAVNLSKTELMQLITAFDSDAQRKMTQQRLGDTGKLDRAVDLEMRLAQIQIVKAYEADQ